MILARRSSGNAAEGFSAVNRAARLDSAGESGDILMDEDTYFFVKDDYEIGDFGIHPLKGFEKPVHIFRLKSDTLDQEIS